MALESTKRVKSGRGLGREDELKEEEESHASGHFHSLLKTAVTADKARPSLDPEALGDFSFLI